jgi:hypothetical protein
MSAILVLPLVASSTAEAGISQTATWVAGGSAGTTAPSCETTPAFNKNNFGHSTRISNKFLPLVPGMQFTLDGTTTDDEGVRLPRRVILTVTDLTKVINGVRTVVLWDRDLADGELVESELTFQAQDNKGSVWNLGEYPEEYENGKFVGAPSTWIAGLAGAKAGIHMLAKPKVGSAEYLQGLAPRIDFLDCGKVFKTGVTRCTPTKCYDNVLIINERSPLEPDSGIQRKFYAPGVGNVKITAVGDPEGETLDLTRVVRLNKDGLAKARRAALKLEKRAYEVSSVYRKTPPAERC